MTPEENARQRIDAMLAASGWTVQTKDRINSAARGVAIAELAVATGEPDYTLFVDAKAIVTVEAKPEGHSLTGVEEQSAKYVTGASSSLPAWRNGGTARQWRDANPRLEGNMRDYATIEQLVVLANLEGMNAEFIPLSLPQGDRLRRLNAIAIRQRQTLTANSALRQLEPLKGPQE